MNRTLTFGLPLLFIVVPECELSQSVSHSSCESKLTFDFVDRTTFNALRNMDIMPGDVVGVQGIGGLGSLAIQFAVSLQPSLSLVDTNSTSREIQNAAGYKVVALSTSGAKEELAKKLGAHVYVDGSKEDQAEALQKLGGAKVILGNFPFISHQCLNLSPADLVSFRFSIALAPNGDAMSKLVGGLAVNGQLLVIALGDSITVPMAPMIQKRLQIRGWPSGTAQDSEETVKFAQAQGIECMCETFKLDEVQEAYDRMMEGKARFRCVLKME